MSHKTSIRSCASSGATLDSSGIGNGVCFTMRSSVSRLFDATTIKFLLDGNGASTK